MPASRTSRSVIRFATASTPLGAVLVAADRRGLRAVLLGDHPAALARDLRTRFAGAEVRADRPALAGAIRRILRLIEAPGMRLGLPLSPGGTPFQRRVWRALGATPLGSTASYGVIARRIGAPAAARAVARACGANPLAIVVPCHRVVRGNGGLGGYRWGIARKRDLLSREASA